MLKFFALGSAALCQALEKNRDTHFLNTALCLVVQLSLFISQNLRVLSVIYTRGRTLCYMVPLRETEAEFMPVNQAQP